MFRICVRAHCRRCFLADSNTVCNFKQLIYFNFLYSTNRKLKLKYWRNIEADKKETHSTYQIIRTNTMVRVIAELSTSPLASSSLSDRYKYRYGCGGDDERGCGCGCGGETIKKHLAEINETNTRVTMMVEIRRNMQKLHEKQQVREINEKSEKEKQEQREREQEEELRRQERRIQEREQEERKKREINTKLGKIIYKTRNGGVFEAHHSVHMTVNSNYDRKTRQMVQTYTEKIIWKDRVFESKQEWFSEMNRQCTSSA